MSDLIININLDESRKKQGLVIETYEGIIPKLKSKKYSGQLRNVNLSSVNDADNLKSENLQNIKSVFNAHSNIQIGKNQYIFSTKQLPYLKRLVELGCIFCKETRKGPMYQVERLMINVSHDKMTCIKNFSVYQEQTILYFCYDEDSKEELENEIIPLFYINVSTNDYISELYFDYGNDIVRADEKIIKLDNSEKYRNYRFEQEIIEIVKQYNWKNISSDTYKYIGKDISYDIKNLEQTGIRLFTNNRKKISVAEFSNISISYGIDWFEIKGDVKAGDITISLKDFIDFRKKKESWTEYNGQIVFASSGLKEVDKNISSDNEGNIIVSKDDILSALETVNYFSEKNYSLLDDITYYQDINLSLSSKLQNILRDYQIVGVKWLLSLRKNGFGGCLADDMGLGKTLQIISYLSDKSQEETKALIVVPKTLIENWKREFYKFASELSVYIYHGSGRNILGTDDYRVVITTYGTLLNDIDKLSKLRFDHLIVDEAQNIKNSNSKAYRAIKLIQATTKIIMTGTPLENNIQEFWGLMKITNPTELSFKKISKGLSDEQVIEKIKKLTKPFLLRRFKSDVLDDLPEKEEQIIYCTFDESQRQLYSSLLESIKHEISRKADRFEMKTNSMVLSGLLYLQEVCCHPRLIPREYNTNKCAESAKLEQLILMVKELYEAGHKIVIFSRFTRMLEIIRKELYKQHFNVFYLDGSTGNRQEVVDGFECSVDGIFLISLKAGGVGINLVSADTAIIYDPWWNPAVEKQAEDRIYRIGQKKKVTIYRLIAADTIEEKVQNLQETKKKLFDDVIDGHEMPQNITMEDIKNLLF
ncbi:SNF2-related protein [Lachnospiraceae bacterium C1.1]|nr:DEAD/DEAH box helicase [Lachnospiraceae bacterium C1.1]